MTYREIYTDLHWNVRCEDKERWYRALYRRKEFLNSIFEFSEENVALLQQLNDKLVELLGDMDYEGNNQLRLIQNRNAEEEVFLDNWVINGKIILYATFYYDIYFWLRLDDYESATCFIGYFARGGSQYLRNEDNEDIMSSRCGKEYPIGGRIKNLCEPMRYFMGEYSPYSLRDLIRLNRACLTLSVKLRNVKCF